MRHPIPSVVVIARASQTECNQYSRYRPGAERYQNIASHADPNLASEESALLGTPEEIIARLKKLEAGGVDYVLLVDPTGSQEALRMFAEEIMPAFPDAPVSAQELETARP